VIEVDQGFNTRKLPVKLHAVGSSWRAATLGLFRARVIRISRSTPLVAQ
jgi:hypothetical protein